LHGERGKGTGQLVRRDLPRSSKPKKAISAFGLDDTQRIA
jgi:hypothetical protein